ncbi:MAG: hypothetical protein N3B13_00630 [Deltaproteobacteria bacterium]|nr:hypothetical protein [Deltaproteobacteria bacterium]
MTKKIVLAAYLIILIWIILCPAIGVGINVFSKKGYDRVESIVVTSKICAAASLRFNTKEEDCYNYTSYYEFPWNIKKIEMLAKRLSNEDWKKRSIDLINRLNSDQNLKKEIFFRELKELQEEIINTKF